MNYFSSIWFGIAFTGLGLSCGARAEEITKEAYVHAVVQGAGLVAGQTAEVSEAERAFRAEIEGRKEELLAGRTPVRHPALITPEELAQAHGNLKELDWARNLLASNVALAEYVLQQPEGWIENMVPELSPANSYGFTCPRCVGDKSQEAVGQSGFSWSYRNPEVITCRACGQVFPDAAYPETEVLQFPRMGQSIHYYLNAAERAHPEDRSGKYAYHWVGYPVHLSFSGMVREQKIGFMRSVSKAMALAYVFEQKPEYAAAVRDILLRFAKCYRNWLYHDYWDTFADCDPMYAAWHDKALPLVWKRHAAEQAYAEDTAEKAGMLQTYWGAGRMHPSTDNITGIGEFALAYDLTCAATDATGGPVWTEAERQVVERDLLLEYLMGAEPYAGGAGKAENANNKSPRVYRAMAEVAVALGLPNYADLALRGYERVRDESFRFDGFSKESPSYTDMYLHELVMVPEVLNGFQWPAGFPDRNGTVDYFHSDAKLQWMFRDVLWSLLPDATYLPLSDTHVGQGPSLQTVQIGLKRYPQLFSGLLPHLYKNAASEYAWFHLSPAALAESKPLELPETLAPAWRTAILRHGQGSQASTVTLTFNEQGGHRHRDNLALFFSDHGRNVLGDLGYVGDMPINDWIRSSFSHNLVLVDDQEQAFEGRVPELEFMATSPLASVVEASSSVYPQCSEYRRCVALLKLPANNSLVVDIFRVRGGGKHAYRLYSEVAANDAAGGTLHFTNVAMPEEGALPQVGASLAREDIFGLRDVRRGTPQGESWQATWQDKDGAFRVWMISPCDRIEASNGPGQRTREEVGRRVRYVDAIRERADVQSEFVAVHEAARTPEELVVKRVERLAGPGVALKISTDAGTCFVFSEIDEPCQAEGLNFAGRFGVVRTTANKPLSYLAVAPKTLETGGHSLIEGPARAAAAAKASGEMAIQFDPAPEAWPALQAQAYLRVKTPQGWTGLPVSSVAKDQVLVKDYPAPEISEASLEAVYFGEAGN